MSGNRGIAKQMAIAHFYISNKLNSKTRLLKPSVLMTLQKQLEGSLRTVTAEKRAAFVGYWIYSQKPFSTGNLRTSAVLVVAISGRGKVAEITRLLRGGASVDELVGALK